MKLRAILFAVAPVFAVLACSSSPPPAAAPGAGTAGKGSSVGDKCLAIAGAEHPRKPDEPSRVGVKHILVKYAGAKGAAASVSRTREAACLRALEALDKLKQGTSWADAVATYSEENGAATREGSIGYVSRSDLVPTFADAAFELGRSEVSDVVETPFGFHVIMRSE